MFSFIIPTRKVYVANNSVWAVNCLHFIGAGGIAGPGQPVAIAELAQQSHGRNTTIGDSPTSKYLPTRHTK